MLPWFWNSVSRGFELSVTLTWECWWAPPKGHIQSQQLEIIKIISPPLPSFLHGTRDFVSGKGICLKITSFFFLWKSLQRRCALQRLSKKKKRVSCKHQNPTWHFLYSIYRCRFLLNLLCSVRWWYQFPPIYVSLLVTYTFSCIFFFVVISFFSNFIEPSFEHLPLANI